MCRIGASDRFRERSDLLVAEAVGHVVVDHSDRLHKRINDSGTDEAEAAFFQVLAQRIGFGGGGGQVAALAQRIALGLAAHELPYVGIEAAELLLHRKERLRVGNRGIDLQANADDALVVEQAGDFALAVFCDLARVKPVIGGSIVLALAENRVPAKAGLGALKDQELEQFTIIVKRDPPLAIVVGDLEVIVGPETPDRGLHTKPNLAV